MTPAKQFPSLVGEDGALLLTTALMTLLLPIHRNPEPTVQDTQARRAARLRALLDHQIVYAETPLFAGGCLRAAALSE